METLKTGLTWLWRLSILAAILWVGTNTRQDAAINASDVQATAAAWADLIAKQAEQLRLLRIICLNSVTQYDARRGVCSPGGQSPPPGPTPFPEIYKGGRPLK